MTRCDLCLCLGVTRCDHPACLPAGWLNLLGQFASLSSTHYVMTLIIEVIVMLSTGTAFCCDQPPPSVPFAPYAPSAPGLPPGADYPPPASYDYVDTTGSGFVFTKAMVS